MKPRLAYRLITANCDEKCTKKGNKQTKFCFTVRIREKCIPSKFQFFKFCLQHVYITKIQQLCAFVLLKEVKLHLFLAITRLVSYNDSNFAKPNNKKRGETAEIGEAYRERMADPFQIFDYLR